MTEHMLSSSYSGHGRSQLLLTYTDRESSLLNWLQNSDHRHSQSDNVYRFTNLYKTFPAIVPLTPTKPEIILPEFTFGTDRSTCSLFQTSAFTFGFDGNSCPDIEHLEKRLNLSCHSDKEEIFFSCDELFRILQMEELDVHKSRQLLLLMVFYGLDCVSFFSDHLIRLFVSEGTLLEAHAVFQRLVRPTVYSWQSFISGCVSMGENRLAIDLFHQMQQAGVKPNAFVYTSILKACGDMQDISQGRKIHDKVLEDRFILNIFVGTALVDMYIKCELLEAAHQVFHKLPERNVVTWNSLIGGYVKNGYTVSALQMFNQMQIDGIKPDKVTFLYILKASGIAKDVNNGVRMHLFAVECGLDSNLHVGSALIDMYCKFGDLYEAFNLFQKLPSRDSVSWSVMIAGFVLHDECLSALETFEKMQMEGIFPDAAVHSSALKACGRVGALQRGKQLHSELILCGKIDEVVVSTLVDMYARCGCLDEARQVLDDWPNAGIVSWGALIAGYALHGYFNLADTSFKYLQRLGFQPNATIYTSILTACAHAAKVQEGCDYFKTMRENQGYPSVEHYGCMSDLLARSGYLDEAEELVESMPIVPDIKSWMSLLTACRKYKNARLGRVCFNHIVRLDVGSAAGYQLMMQLCADMNMWDSVQTIKALKMYANAWKMPGRAFIEVNNKLHQFVVGGNRHPMWDNIRVFLKNLKKPMEEEGYVPETELVLQPMSLQAKEDELCGHCEKLAIAFGMLSSPEGVTLRVSKNLRMCRDCHTAAKVLSKIGNRQIIVSDQYCVHHFSGGFCSCGDNL